MPTTSVAAAKLLPLIRAGVAAAPGRPDLQLQLAKALFQTDALAELIERFAPGITATDADPELLYHLGLAAAASGDHRLAHDALRAAAKGGYAPAFGYLAEALRRLGRDDEALDAGLRGLHHLPSDFKALGIVVRTLLERGERERVRALCAGLLERGAWNAYVPSALALAADTPDRDADVAALIDAPRRLAAAHLGVADDFNAGLAAELLAHPALAPLPSTKATSGAGRRIDRLQDAAGPLARELLARIAAAVEEYAVRRDAGADHPLRERRPAATVLNAWAIAVHDDGHEEWHMHPGGWISGVYYVAVPPAATPADDRPGAIEFGPFPLGGDGASRGWPRRRVTPRAGMLLLFPSYFAHRTWPTGVAEPRICVAFDVVAAAGAQ